ncbi:hypothetical protein CRG98_031397 [Punica granatum]|uniref:Uncharacterized protein n=1 Tax=Punica granatum TaxID=22663 RepID=A0A2I0IX14_PUNGR|nr:hypothetical protein CRG98_031397 [Punica granatum]
MHTKGRALFYYFVEAENSKNSLPLLLWLNGDASPQCNASLHEARSNIMQGINLDNIYAPLCGKTNFTLRPKKASDMKYDARNTGYVDTYLNLPKVAASPSTEWKSLLPFLTSSTVALCHQVPQTPAIVLHAEILAEMVDHQADQYEKSYCFLYSLQAELSPVIVDQRAHQY